LKYLPCCWLFPFGIVLSHAAYAGCIAELRSLVRFAAGCVRPFPAAGYSNGSLRRRKNPLMPRLLTSLPMSPSCSHWRNYPDRAYLQQRTGWLLYNPSIVALDAGGRALWLLQIALRQYRQAAEPDCNCCSGPATVRPGGFIVFAAPTGSQSLLLPILADLAPVRRRAMRRPDAVLAGVLGAQWVTLDVRWHPVG